VRLEAPLDDFLLQGLATSLNQSETAFLWRNDGRWMLRWFTPSREVPLCGHATLAACVALGRWGLLQPLEPIQLFTRSGPLPIQLQPTAAGQLSTAQIELPTEVLEADECPVYLQRLLLDALGSPPLTFWRSQLGYAVVLIEPSCRLETMASLASQLEANEANGLVVMQALSANADEGPMVLDRRADYQLRFFAPGLGIPEDPVTGSAHALVAPYWMQICSRSDVVGWQCSPRPGGMVCERVDGDRIQIRGSAYLLLEGTINLDAPPTAVGWMLP
jgi:PhzF family phenazine biosynthesis protein